MLKNKNLSEKNFFLLILFISFLPILSIFLTPKLLHTHDGLVHLPRIAEYFKSLSDFQFPVRWAGNLNYGYGMPLFNFIYHTPYFLSSIFIFLGFDLINSFKIVLSLSFVLSGFFMFLFSKAFFLDSRKAFLVTVFYQFAPFRLVEVLIRGSFGEVYTYAFFPLLLYGLVLLNKKLSFKNVAIISFASFFLIISHNALSLSFFSVALLFSLILLNKNLIWQVISLGIGLLMSSFYWIPAILEHKFTYGDVFMQKLYLSHFPPILNFFIPNFTNSKMLEIEGISVQFGFFHVIALSLSLLLIIKNKIDRRTKSIFIFSLLIVFLSLFLMQPISKFLWEKISLLRQFQFPWRLLGIVSFATSLLSVSFLNLSFFKRKIVFWSFIFLVIISTAFYWKPSLGYDEIDSNYYWNFPLTTTYFGETDLIWSEGPQGSYPKKEVDVIGGKAIIENYVKKSKKHTFVINAKTDAQIVDHTQYFPGWRVYANGKTIPVEFQDINWRGQITFYVPKGISEIKVVFEESKIRLAADLISVFGVLVIFGLGLSKRIYEV